MILTHEAILKAQKEGKLIIDPFDPNLVSINSVDVRLGKDLWFLKKTKSYRDLYIPDDTTWQKIEPITAGELRETPGQNYKGWAKGIVPDDAECFVLKSGEFYLATTLEAIGTSLPEVETMSFGKDTLSRRPGALVPEMKAKSTVGRQGLTVALCAGLGDVGYTSRWGLEVRVTDDGDIPIAVGTPIAQVVFSQATPTEKTYDGVDRYQNGKSTRFLPKPLKHIRSPNDS